ncbi:MAG: hypothetical protein KBD01_03905 [Acidobacteria bacterium]|nr:hypothetical protein [Acidobacteriota bacterium]
MSHVPTGLRRAASLAVAGILALSSAGATATRPAGPEGPDLRRELAASPAHDSDPLAPFQLSLGIDLQELERSTSARVEGRLRANEDQYVHVVLPSAGPGDASVLPAPTELAVLDGDFYFHNGAKLEEAVFVIEATLGSEQAIRALERWLGEPEFEIVLPGALDLIVGWRTPNGCMVATFNDLPVFRVSVFRNDPDDLMAGSQIVMFEGLTRYAERLAAGDSPSVLMAELMKAVNWAAMARSIIEAVP